MEIESKVGNGFTILAIKGRLDAVSAANAESTLNGVIDAGAVNLAVNLSGLDYVSSAGLRVLLVIAKKLSRQNGKITLYGLQSNVREVFEISGFLSIFHVVANEEEAIKSIGTM